jgi:hypothetical protein
LGCDFLIKWGYIYSGGTLMLSMVMAIFSGTNVSSNQTRSRAQSAPVILERNQSLGNKGELSRTANGALYDSVTRATLSGIYVNPNSVSLIPVTDDQVSIREAIQDISRRITEKLQTSGLLLIIADYVFLSPGVSRNDMVDKACVDHISA